MRYLAYIELNRAKRYLKEIIELKRAVPFFRYNRDIPHRKNIDEYFKIKQGRYPVKPAKVILKYLEVLEKNAKNLNLDPNKIVLLPSIIEKGARLPYRLNRIGRRISGKRINVRIYGIYIENLDPNKKYKRKELKKMTLDILKQWQKN